MLSYFGTGSNYFSIHTQPFISSSSNLVLNVEDMYLLTTQSFNISGSAFVSYNEYESILSFSLDLPYTNTGYEYRLSLSNTGSVIYNGTMQVYRSQSVNKADYVNQNNQYKSKLSGNEFIILQS
jgi:hypothetical protein